jgi:hypothetical protein
MTRALERWWSLSGFPDALVVDWPEWDRPASVSLDGDDLIWDYVAAEEGAAFGWASLTETLSKRPSPAPADRNLLHDFLRLAEGTSEAVHAFASKWGMLHLCDHGLPRTHPPLPGVPRSTIYCQEFEVDDLHGREPVSGWLRWAATMRSVAVLAADFHAGETRRDHAEQWARLLPNREPPATSDQAAKELAEVVQLFLWYGLVMPWVDLTGPRITIRGRELFGTLAVQLLLVAVQAEGLAICKGCRLPFAPKRRPAAKRRSYCPDCRAAGEPQKDASAAYRQKERDAVIYLACSISANPWLSTWLSGVLSKRTPHKM